MSGTENEPLVRLNKLLASRGIASRRHIEEMIVAGRIRVDGETATEKGQKVRPEAVIEVDGRAAETTPPPAWIALHKPRGYVTTKEDTHDRPIIMDLIPPELRHLNPVGRLDGDVSGLILLTNDGQLAYRLTHPRYSVGKTYHVTTSRPASHAQMRRVAAGLELDDGPTAPAECWSRGRAGDGSLVELTIHEGRKHQVKRMFDAVGNPVRGLVRVAVGPVSLGELGRGLWRHLTADEVGELYRMVGLVCPEGAVPPAPATPDAGRGSRSSRRPRTR